MSASHFRQVLLLVGIWLTGALQSTHLPDRLHSLMSSRTSYIITCVFTFITAAVIAEICSSLPLAGSIYLWAAEAGGPRCGRLFGFIVAWWSTTAWTTFCASNTQAAVNYMLSVGSIFFFVIANKYMKLTYEFSGNCCIQLRLSF